MMAVREGVEPSIPYDIHTFQACSFGHSDTSPIFYNYLKLNTNCTQRARYRPAGVVYINFGSATRTPHQTLQNEPFRPLLKGAQCTQATTKRQYHLAGQAPNILFTSASGGDGISCAGVPT